LADLFDDIRRRIDRRLAELRPQIEEIPRLEAALKALEEANGARRSPKTRTGSRAASSGRAPRRGRKRAPRGHNREAVLAAIRDRPGGSIGEISELSGVTKPTIYAVVRKLEQEGGVKRRKDGGLSRGS
jgi:DNA-binding transcriptional ArsR family regulator